MPAIKDLATIAAKWRERVGVATGEYEQGVRNPRRDWAQAAQAAQENWNQGVQQAVSEGRFAKGVQRAGSQKWQQKALEVGTQRWAPGVQAAQAEYEQGFAPFAQVIQSTQLPPRGPKGDPNNIQRVAVLARALNEAKRRQG